MSSAGNSVKSAPISAPWVAIVLRSVIGSWARPGPPNSTHWLVAAPYSAATCRNTSLPLTHSCGAPVSSYRTVGGTWYQVRPVQTICSISAGPSPRAAAPTAPAAQVCESVQATTIPGWTRPCSASTWCTMPCLPTSKNFLMPWAAAKARAFFPDSASLTEGAGTA